MNTRITMGDKTLKARDFLIVFNLILTDGVKVEGEHNFLGIRAWHDFEGYTCWLAYKDLTVTLLFHGSFFIDYEQKDTLDEFYKKVNSQILFGR
jgi:hypothetical protein